MRAFRQVDVFSRSAFGGNALAVVHDADGLTDTQMAAVARWTNLSETAFLTAPSCPGADYAVRIWTTGGELPFAGHPTIGSTHAWLEAGGVPGRDDVVVQECGVGLAEVRRAERLAFVAPPLLRSGPVHPGLRRLVARALAVEPSRVLDMAWVDNGPGWIGVELDSAATVLAITPDVARFTDLKVCVLGRYAAAEAQAVGADVEVRAFYAQGDDFGEDPVTGSANAGLAQWLVGAGRLPDRYVARQGTVLERNGRVHIESVAGRVWVGGDARTLITGEVHL